MQREQDRSRQGLPWRHRGAIIAAMAALVLAGCGKVPTWEELNGGPKKPAPSQTTMVPSVVEVPSAQPQTPAKAPDAAETVAWFKRLSPQQMTDQGFAQLTSITSGLEAITEIDANTSLVTDQGLKELSKLPALQKLNLASTKITDEGVKSLQGVASLQSLSLAATLVTAKGIEQLAPLPQLKRLDLMGCKLSQAEFAEIGKLPALETLILNRMPGLNDSGLDLICEATTLKVLELNECDGFTDKGLASLAKPPGLEELYVAKTRINGGGFGAAISAGGLKALKVLVVSYDPIGPQGIRAINLIKSLERLELGFVTDFNDVALVECLKGMEHLKYLNVEASPKFTGQAFAKIKSTADSLETIDAQNTYISDPALGLLKAHKKLKFINASNTYVTVPGIQQFKRFVPGCEILYGGIRR